MKIKRLPQLDTTFSKIDFGSIIKKYRQECGLSQEELAKQVCFKTATALSLIESNKRKISAEKFFQILEVTQAPFNDLIE